MTCREARDYQADSLDHGLDREARQKLAQHLDGCPACREEYRLLTKARWLLSTYGPVPCPVDFTALATRGALPVRARWPLPRLWARLALTTLLVTLGGVGWQWRRESASLPLARPRPAQLVIRDVAEVREIHEAFAVQQSLQGRDGLLLFAPDWGDRG